jgi:hypothetical protein
MGGQVLNKRSAGIPDGAVSIGRPSVFGNPFVIGEDGDRETVVVKLREYAIDRAYRDPAFRQAVAGLVGNDLVCWCAPALCHGDVLVELAERFAAYD